MKRFLLGLILLASPAAGQTPLPVLTKAQMQADFEVLTAALTRINPHDFVRRRVNGYGQTDSILALRPALDTVRSTASFFWLVNKALTYCQDGHTAVLDKRFIPYLDSADRAAFTPTDTAIVRTYDQLRRRRLAAYRLPLPLKYIDGAYTVLVPFAYVPRYDRAGWRGAHSLRGGRHPRLCAPAARLPARTALGLRSPALLRR